ncbi:MAG: response regulator [Spirochaetales bacterium]|nr:response regulator [Spirochaetales bacterium]
MKSSKLSHWREILGGSRFYDTIRSPNTSLLLIISLSVMAYLLNFFTANLFSNKNIANLELKISIEKIDSQLNQINMLSHSFIQDGDRATWEEIQTTLEGVKTTLRTVEGHQENIGRIALLLEEYEGNLNEIRDLTAQLELEKGVIQTAGSDLEKILQEQLIDPLTHEEGMRIFHGKETINPFQIKAKDTAYEILNFHTAQRLILLELLLSSDREQYIWKREDLAQGLANSSQKISYIAVLLGDELLDEELVKGINEIIAALNLSEQSVIRIFTRLLEIDEQQTAAAKELKGASSDMVREISESNRENKKLNTLLSFVVLLVILIVMGWLCLLLARQVVKYVRDIHDTESKLETVLESIRDGVLVTDRAGRVVRINREAARLTGYEQKAPLPIPLDSIYRLRWKDKLLSQEELIHLVREENEIIGSVDEAFLVSSGKEPVPIVQSGASLLGEEGDFLGIVLLFRDVTDEKERIEQLRQSEKMDAIGQLAGGVAHDFNNMLGGISGASELLEMHLAEDSWALQNIDIIKNAAERAAGLTGKLLSFSRKGSHVSSTFDLHGLLRDVVAILERTLDRRIRIIYEPEAPDTMVSGDPSQLQSGFINICVNARDAMPEGGEIRIGTKNIFLDEEYCGVGKTLTPGSYIQISLEDNGTGIPPEVQSRIFEPFFTTKEVGKGTGLGLAAVYGMVKDHRGDIRLYSEMGKGTVFHIYIPVVPDRKAFVPAAEGDVFRGNGTILVVDDEDIIRSTASMLLEHMGYTVLLAEDGKQGVAVYKENHHKIDLVILDMIMPVMNGRDAFGEIRKINPRARVILASGFSRNKDVERMFSKGLSGFIKKPYNRRELGRLLGEVLPGDD